MLIIIKQLYVRYKTALLISCMWVSTSQSIYAHAQTFAMKVSSSVLGEFDHVQ